jgi:DNA-binding MltR family transcriptional regulator
MCPVEPEIQRQDFALFIKESERGCALIGAALIDEGLANLFRAVFVPGTADELLKPERPLSSLSARTRTAYALGLINRQNFQDIELVRKIRNDAAHFESRRGDGLATGFSNQATVSRCRSLSIAPALAASVNCTVEELAPRMIFCFAVAVLGALIESSLDVFVLGMASTSRIDALARVMQKAAVEMSTEQMVAYLKKLPGDPDFRAKLVIPR